MSWWRQRVSEGTLIPKGYGVAYREPWTDIAWCYPLPFNWIIRWAMNLYWIILCPRKTNRRERDLIAAYDWGYSRGLKEKKDEYIRALIKMLQADRDKKDLSNNE